MPLHSYFVLLAFSLLGLVLIVQIAGMRGDSKEIVGEPTIDKYYFFSGKIALITTWVMFIRKAISPALGYIIVPVYLQWIAVGLLWIGAIVTGFALIGLGKSLKIGLPRNATTLQTKGIYRFSRNPLYTGVFIISAASGLYFPDLINVTFAIYGIYIHHTIILGEEAFLAQRFGNAWENYTNSVKRYL